MGLSLRNSLIGNELIPYTGLKKTQTSTTQCKQRTLLPIDPNIEDYQTSMNLNMTDEELINIIQQAESENQEYLLSQQQKQATTFDGRNMTQVVPTNTTASKKSNPQIPMFQGCTFNGNLTINILTLINKLLHSSYSLIPYFRKHVTKFSYFINF